MGWIDAAAYDTVLGLLAALGLTFARVGTVKG
jgi:hypothetical protein